MSWRMRNRPRIGTTVYCRQTGQPWTVANVGPRFVTLKRPGYRSRRWVAGGYWQRRCISQNLALRQNAQNRV